MTGKLFIISASSGAGKTTLARELVKRMRERIPLELIVGYTSRKPRKEEMPERDYHFISTDAFEGKIAQGEFLEWNAGYGNYYGTSNDVLSKLQDGISCVVVVGIRGIEAVLRSVPDAIAIWIMVSDVADLEKRLKIRTADHEYLKQRLEVAKREAEWIKSATLFQYKVVNDHFDDAVFQLQNIVSNELEKK